jgi:hypothetical protein
MITTKFLPGGYSLRREIDLHKDLATLVKLNIWGMIMLFPVSFLLYWLSKVLRPKPTSIAEIVSPQLSAMAYLTLIILAFIAVMVIHELLHGIVFWKVTHQLPKFGFRGAYAFAAAPDWFIPRNVYFYIGAAPLVIISCIGVLLIPIIPVQFLGAWLFGVLMNTIGAVGDIYVLFVLVRLPASILVRDQGDVISFYGETAL